MSKILVEVYLPAALRSFDIRIPGELKLRQITPLVASAVAQMAWPLYSAGQQPVLCDRETGKILNVNMNPWQLGLKNGARLMLI